MKPLFHKVGGMLKLVIIFIALTFFFYGMIVWIGDQVYKNYRYDGPKGRAIKVVQQVEQPNQYSGMEFFLERLRFYYWFGE
ncbi:DUF4227 family protein [Bacillus horti]|uniref:DUF4227 family protein n=1 Tax=Caldalkalibacillus horti TaxID=77523 RepID=A0ABT9VU63_9BACI|nr:DUF4227 family protein [Bacillus horti]MDQ0164527.1 hypothetical protein [Bacillus horti]